LNSPLPGARSVLRLVLDTNVWLDWLVFDDPGVAGIKTAVTAGTAEIFIDAACLRELERILARPLRRSMLDSVAQKVRLAQCRRATREVGGDAATSLKIAQKPPLPRCSDRDDQKFLELAQAAGADYLVTKDRALLVLNRRKTRPPPCRIVTPAQLPLAPPVPQER